jgi:hypothetical protein
MDQDGNQAIHLCKGHGDKLVQIHQLKAKEYPADMQEELHGLGITEGDDPMKFMERFIFFLLSCTT